MARVLITGTSKGIGYDASLQLARSGHEVVATMRNPNASDLGKVASEESLPIEILTLDVDDQRSIAEVFGEQASRIDVLVNNAGILSCNAIEDEDVEKFQAVMNTNFFGAVRCCKAVIPHMREKRGGCIINVASVAGKMAITPSAAYCSSKFALEAFTEIMAQELTTYGVRVALVEPGIISTPMATTELPKYKQDTVYPQGRRYHAIFKFTEQALAPASIVSDKIQYIIESGTTRLRHPVGPDSLNWLGLRHATSDEHLIDMHGTESDEEYIEKLNREVGMDLTGFL